MNMHGGGGGGDCRWSTIAAQLPGRTDNEIKNYWNTHLKKRLIHLGINPDTYAPASPLSLPPPSNSSPNSSSSSPAINHPHLGPTSSFSAARHMAQWESARLEAEARLSRQSLLFSSSSSSSVSPPSSFPAHHYNTESEAKIVVEKQQDAPDVILRIWNSEVGEAFRKPVAVAAAASKGGDNEVSETDQERVVLAKGEAASSSSAVTVSEVGHAGVSERKEEVDDESISKAEEVMDETYDQFYMDLAGGEDELSLFQAQMGTSSCFSLFTCDLDEASLDNPFK